MKKTVSVLLFSLIFVMNLTPSISYAAEDIGKQEVIITHITGEENIRKYQESLGEEYDPNLIEVYREEVVPVASVSTNARYCGNDYYVKNKTVRTETDMSTVVRQYNRPEGTVTVKDSVTLSNSYSATGGITATILKGELGYNVTESNTFSVDWSRTYEYPIIIKVYAIYEIIQGEIWEDDIFFDDKVGSFTAKRALGDDIRIYKQ